MRPLPPGTLWPHSAIRKYIGTSIISHRKKNRNRSSVMNTPTTPPRFHSRFRGKKPTLRSISRTAQVIAAQRALPAEEAGDEGNQDEPDEDHFCLDDFMSLLGWPEMDGPWSWS